MNDEPTKDLTDSEILRLLLAEMQSFHVWRDKVDAFMADRSRDTKPLLGEIRKELQQGFVRVEDRLSRIERNFGVLTQDMVDLRARQNRLEDRFDEMIPSSVSSP